MRGIIGDAALLALFRSLDRHAPIGLAVSGGPDSMALMALTRRWVSLTGRDAASIRVLTVDHGLRPESKTEADLVARQAAAFDFSHVTLTWEGDKPKTAIQESSRAARYRLMTDRCRADGISCLVTAHTRNDQAETVLMRLRRGSGLEGLAAMAVVTERDGMPLVRPLLGVSKARLVACLRAESIPYVNDPSNDNARFERVRLRHAMVAIARAGIGARALAQSAARLSRSREALSAVCDDILVRHFEVGSLAQGRIEKSIFSTLPEAIAIQLLGQAVALIGGRSGPVNLAKLERLASGLNAGVEEATLGGCLITVVNSRIELRREPGRISKSTLPVIAGMTATWDGRFILAFPPVVEPETTLSPLGMRGWAEYRRDCESRKISREKDSVAAITTPAVWRGSTLVAAPALGFTKSLEPSSSVPLPQIRLVPSLVRLLKPI